MAINMNGPLRRFYHRNIAHNTAGDIDSGYEDVEGVLY